MFDFEKLEVYQLVQQTNLKTLKLLYSNTKIDQEYKQQWKRASLSMLLNLVEGSGRFTTADKKHFMTMSRSSVFECTAILQLACDMGWISDDVQKELYSNYEQISKMLLGMFRSYGADNKK